MKPTASQSALMHTVESAAASAILTILAGVYQYITSHSLDIPGLLAFLGTAFLGAMFMVYKSLLANPALPQAESDTENQVVGFLSNEFAQFVGGHFKALEDAIANHSHTPLPTAPAPSSVPQLAFPANTTASIPSPSLVVTQSAPQPQAQLLNTFPTLQAVPQPRG